MSQRSNENVRKDGREALVRARLAELGELGLLPKGRSAEQPTAALPPDRVPEKVEESEE